MTKPTVAIIGASTDRTKFGNKSIRAHQQAGYDVYPVNPKGGEIEGLPAYSSITDVPGALQRVSLYLPPHIGETMLSDIATKGCDELWFNPGTSTPALEEQARELGLNVITGCSIVDVGISPADL